MRLYCHTSDTATSRYDHLYPGHIQTSTFQKILLTGISSVVAITDPARDGELIFYIHVFFSIPLCLLY